MTLFDLSPQFWPIPYPCVYTPVPSINDPPFWMICLAFTKQNLSHSLLSPISLSSLAFLPAFLQWVSSVCSSKNQCLSKVQLLFRVGKNKGKEKMSDNKNKRKQNIILALVSVSLRILLFCSFVVTWGNVLPRTERWGQFCLHSLSLPLSFSLYQVFFILSIHFIVFPVPSQPDLWLFCPFRGIVVPKVNILSDFTHPHALPNLYDDWSLHAITKGTGAFKVKNRCKSTLKW